MKTLARRSLLVLALVASGLVALVFFRAITWSSAQIAVDAIPPLAVDDGAIERLAAAIRLPTVAPNAGGTGTVTAFDSFHRHLEASFPKVHAVLTREVVGSHGLLFTWPGKDLASKADLALGSHGRRARRAGYRSGVDARCILG